MLAIHAGAVTRVAIHDWFSIRLNGKNPVYVVFRTNHKICFREVGIESKAFDTPLPMQTMSRNSQRALADSRHPPRTHHNLMYPADTISTIIEEPGVEHPPPPRL
jgi:hypothetical protein